ncbi:gamma-glutamyltransferase [Halalkalibacter sp. AB-rgal2]|uniref:gamma-glutamyltransferase n=1 Tax=Halalkalibacter sp. AB-rgal2 TaxID=3242695 RepID=UPI00359ECF9C
MKAYRPTTMAPEVMVTSPHYLASQAGVRVLHEGGNAWEAAIAVASTLAVVYPHMNGIGGDSFWLMYDAKSKCMRGLNASGRSGEKATIPFYHERNYQDIPTRGYLAANTVPGAVSGWEQVFYYSQKHLQGTARWSDLFKTAISYAENGFPVTPSQHYWTTCNVYNESTNLQNYREFKKTFLNDYCQPFQTGEVMTLHDLGSTLEEIAEKGARTFYEGSITKAMIEDIEQHDGMLTLDDFASHQSEWVTPLSVPYREYTAFNLPPNTQGMTSLSILNILNQFDFRHVDVDSADYVHLILEATKLAFSDRDQWLTDPHFVDIPIDELLSGDRAMQVAKQIQMSSALNHEKLLDPKGDTAWFGVVDRHGHAVSCIQSIYHDFGSGIIPKGTGVLLQNRGSFFSLNPEHINKLDPHKRTFHTLNPAMMTYSSEPLLVYGTMGGEGQPQTQAALVTKMIDYGMSPQEAIEAPRWLYGRTWGAQSNTVKVESRLRENVFNELKRRGHPIERVEPYTDMMGHAGAIWIDPENGMKYGGADPRGDGMAIGY